MTIELSKNTEIIVFTGPESSGKTTTAERISIQYQIPFVEEYARAYLNKNGSDYSLQDIHNIALGQVAQETKANENNALIICDTDLVTLDIWAIEKYGRSLDQEDKLINKKHYFLCYPDIPWEPDPLRENPKDRDRLFEKYKSYLQEIGAHFTILHEDDRINLAFKF